MSERSGEEARVPDVPAWAAQLRQYATHFALSDWCYTRDLGGLRAVRYDDPYNRPLARAGRAFGSLVRKKREWEKPLAVSRAAMFRAHLRRDRHLPDGVLDGGSIITFWEETGEYLQYVQPSVGELLADLMDAHPDLPEVIAIAAEMKRINNDYAARVRSTEDQQ